MSLRDELADLVRSMGVEERHEVLGITELHREVQQLMTTMQELAADYEGFKERTNTHLETLRDRIAAMNNGTIPSDVQAAIDAMDAEVNGDSAALDATDDGTDPGAPEQSGDGTTDAGTAPTEETPTTDATTPAVSPAATQVQSGPIGA